MSRKPDRNREYMKQYMRARRAAVNTLAATAVNTCRPSVSGAVNTLAATAVNTSKIPEAPNIGTAKTAKRVPDPDDVAEYFSERAAILEYDFGLSRADAEAEARGRTAERFGIDIEALK